MKGMKKLWMLLLAVVMTAGMCLPASADTQDEIHAAEEKKAQTESDLEEAQDRINRLNEKKGEAESYLQELDSQLEDLTSQLKDLQEQYAKAQAQTDEVNQELADAENDEEVQRKSMGLRIQYMYENSSGTSGLTAILSGDDFSEILNAASNMSELEDYDRKALKDYSKTCDEVEEKKEELEKQQEELAKVSAETDAKKQELTKVYEDTKSDVEAYAASIGDEESSAADLLASIEDQSNLIAELNEKAADEVKAADEAAAQEQQAAAAQETSDETQTNAVSETENAQNADAGNAANGTGSSSNGSTQSNDNSAAQTSTGVSGWGGAVLTRAAGRIQGPSGGETYYNLDMSGVVNIMRRMGNNDEYWVRADGVKMLGNYVMCAANLSVHPRGSYVQTSLGMGIVCDTGGFASTYPNNLDIATNW